MVTKFNKLTQVGRLWKQKA